MGLSVEPGRVVLFDQDGGVEIGVVIDNAGFKFNVLSRQSEQLQLALSRLQPLEAFLDKRHNSNLSQELSKIWNKASQLAGEVDPKRLHTIVSSETVPIPVEQLAVLVFGADVESAQVIATKIALCTDKLYFKRSLAGFEPRPTSAIQELEAARADLERRAAEIQGFAKGLRDFKTGGANAAQNRWLECLEQTAAGAEELTITQQELKELLTICEAELSLETRNAALPNRAWKILTAVGHFNDRTDTSQYRHRIPRDFSVAALSEATSLAELAIVSDPSREAVTGEVFTIDDESTLDMDDAISLEQTADGYRLGVHISDVSSLISKDSALDQDALLRATSIYMGHRTINMLPECLSEGRLSLSQGQLRPCLSCFFEISPCFALKSSRFALTTVKVTKRLSYNKVDLALDADDPTFSAIYQIASENLTKRIEAGALNMSKEDAYVKLLADGTLTLQISDEDAPSRLLVSELMVMYNVAAAEFCARAKAPIPYRGQDAPKGPPLKNIPDGPALDHAMRARMRRSYTSLTPIRHVGLAVDFYTQATSPIRRYADILVQRQLSALICNEPPPYSLEDLKKISEAITTPLARATAVSKESRRFWMLRYLLETNHLGTTAEGIVVKIEERYFLVELTKIFLTVLVKLTGAAPALGSAVKVKIIGIDPHGDQVRCELA